MHMSDSNFDLITQEVLKQKQVMENLTKENDELRRQIAALRSGQGIFVEILGQRFALVEESDLVSPQVSAAEDTPAQQELSTVADELSTPSQPEPVLAAQASPAADGAAEEAPVNQTPLPSPVSPSFLHEMLLDELSSAATMQMAVPPVPDPITNHPVLDEEEKATLRRELVDSFLLE